MPPMVLCLRRAIAQWTPHTIDRIEKQLPHDAKNLEQKQLPKNKWHQFLLLTGYCGIGRIKAAYADCVCACDN